MTNRWQHSEHRGELRVGFGNTIYHPEQGQLCQVEKHWDGILFHPIQFKDRAAAQCWIDKGSIAEIQESLGNLGVGFTMLCFKSTNRNLAVEFAETIAPRLMEASKARNEAYKRESEEIWWL